MRRRCCHSRMEGKGFACSAEAMTWGSHRLRSTVRGEEDQRNVRWRQKVHQEKTPGASPCEYPRT
jgi:hypothetical protein